MTDMYYQQQQQHVSLNTPIKKIRNLNLNSSPLNYDDMHQDQHNQHYLPHEEHFPPSALPPQPQPPTQLYPSLDLQKSPTESSMLNKGYSHKLTNNVLSELHKRAQQITTGNANGNGYSHSSNSSPSYGLEDQVSQRRNKRYSGLHMTKFKQMESISHHYSVHNRNKTPSPQKLGSDDSSASASATATDKYDTIESASKRRRTLNGANEIMAIPILHQQQNRQSQHPTENRKISPNKISPSKASYNLNSILRQTTDTGSPNKEIWAPPAPPKKLPQLKKRPSSLEMAGVINSSPTRYNETCSGTLNSSTLHMDKPVSSQGSSILQEPSKISNTGSGFEANTGQQHSHGNSKPWSNTPSSSFVKPNVPKKQQLQKKPSIPQLQKKPSIPQLQKKSSIPQLQKKPSIPQLQKKPSIPQLQKKPSIPQLQKKTSISQLQRKPSIPQFHNNEQSNRVASSPSSLPPSTSQTAMKPPTSTNLHHHSKTLQQSSKYHPQEVPMQPSISRMSPSKSFSSFKSHSQHGGGGNGNGNGLYNTKHHQPQSINNSARKVETTRTAATTLPKSKSITIPQPFSLYDKPTISSSQKSLSKYQRFKEKFN
ncbi:hypothetical protein CANMA_002634 [Candida margitis]|uniref:uncharacterized protein n=1 Tax=Candida margitis TaxID=1775924 RepID=UPI0022262BE5|nr:uncharacterized protein CANMA_002634 [Candida margitis]KAI5967866.1 hypothetical protein CANMA_002634 [Candida margitis]